MDINKLNDKNEHVTNKILATFAGAFIYIVFLMFLNNLITTGSTFLIAYNTVKVLIGVSVVIMAVGIYMNMKNMNKDKIITGMSVAVCGAILLLCMAFLYFNMTYSSLVMSYLYAIIPTLAFIHMIYYIYHREFFVISLISATAGTACWFHTASNYSDGRILVISILAIVAILIFTYAGVSIYKKMKKQKTSPFKSKKSDVFMIVSALVGILFVVAAFFIPSAYTLIVLLTLLGIIFMTAVYFTVKLL